MPRLGAERDAGGAGFQGPQLALRDARALREDEQRAALAQVIVAFAEAFLVLGRHFFGRGGPVADLRIDAPVYRDAVGRQEDGAGHGIFEKRAFGQKRHRRPPLRRHEQRVHEGVGVVGAKQHRAARAQPLRVANFNLAKEDAQRKLDQGFDEAVEEHGRKGRKLSSIPSFFKEGTFQRS